MRSTGLKIHDDWCTQGGLLHVHLFHWFNGSGEETQTHSTSQRAAHVPYTHGQCMKLDCVFGGISQLYEKYWLVSWNKNLQHWWRLVIRMVLPRDGRFHLLLSKRHGKHGLRGNVKNSSTTSSASLVRIQFKMKTNVCGFRQLWSKGADVWEQGILHFSSGDTTHAHLITRRAALGITLNATVSHLCMCDHGHGTLNDHSFKVSWPNSVHGIAIEELLPLCSEPFARNTSRFR